MTAGRLDRHGRRGRRRRCSSRTWTIRYPGRREPSVERCRVSVAAGERVGVAGRTGAGKSTLALAAAGSSRGWSRRRSAARMVVEGRDAVTAAAGALLGRVGIVFATPANQLSASKLTVREELAFGLENLGVPRDEMDARIDGDAGAPRDRPPRRPRTVRPVRRRATARGDREHRGDGHRRCWSSTSRPRSSTRPGTVWVAELLDGAGPVLARRSCASNTTRACSVGWTAASCSTGGRRSRSSVPGVARADGGRGGRRIARTDARPAGAEAAGLPRGRKRSTRRRSRQRWGMRRVERRMPRPRPKTAATRRPHHRQAGHRRPRPRPRGAVEFEDLVHRYPSGIEAGPRRLG